MARPSWLTVASVREFAQDLAEVMKAGDGGMGAALGRDTGFSDICEDQNANAEDNETERDSEEKTDENASSKPEQEDKPEHMADPNEGLDFCA